VEQNYQARTVPFQAQFAGLVLILPRTAPLEKAQMRARAQVTYSTTTECTTVPFEYDTRFNTPLPSHHPSCVTVGSGDRDDEADPTPQLPNDPLPVTPPPKSVDGAIADRLQELQDRIRTEHLEKTK
jgi:hypothetical protein